MWFITAIFPIFLTSTAALDRSCACNSLTPGSPWTYNWELTKYTCKHNYAAGANYDSGSGRCVPTRDYMDFDQFQNNCIQAGTKDGFYRYNADETVDTSVKLWVHYASATCD
ncbi:hypothetical protein E4U13_001424 [Claviceps humidiphila]|uniref:Secreted protein n=1 Tax=Claviceps humidiphila TaxID=1294629 RepID=A0A9P7Q5P8_9HYPO|nr:hypothetical protein E4U13_001424 [Claviceps humidiphila]